MAPSTLGGDTKNSLMDYLKTDLMRRLQEAEQGKKASNTRRVERPRPELGRRETNYDPVDISKYL
ncbi:hypothetical protein GF373_05770, partial [bacterium]|nr:hypothetical protein [bacterium]